MDSRCDVVGVSVCIVCTSAALHRPDDDAGVLILTSEFLVLFLPLTTSIHTIIG